MFLDSLSTMTADKVEVLIYGFLAGLSWSAISIFLKAPDSMHFLLGGAVLILILYMETSGLVLPNSSKPIATGMSVGLAPLLFYKFKQLPPKKNEEEL